MIKSAVVIDKVTQRSNRCYHNWSNWWKDILMIGVKISSFEKISWNWVPVQYLVNRFDEWSLFVLVCKNSLVYLTEVLCEFESLTNSCLSYKSMVQKRFESQGHLLVKNPRGKRQILSFPHSGFFSVHQRNFSKLSCTPSVSKLPHIILHKFQNY